MLQTSNFTLGLLPAQFLHSAEIHKMFVFPIWHIEKNNIYFLSKAEEQKGSSQSAFKSSFIFPDIWLVNKSKI